MEIAPKQRPDEVRNLMHLIINCIRRKRKLFLFAMAVKTCVIFGISINFWNLFQSDGFLMAGIPIIELNKYQASLEDRANFASYVLYNKLSDDKNAEYLLHQSWPQLARKSVAPIRPYSKEDRRYVGDGASIAAVLLGFNISFKAKSAEDAAAQVNLMGEYIRDTFLRQGLAEAILSAATKAREEKKFLDNKLIVSRARMQDAIVKRNTIATMAQKYPDAEKFERQLVLSSSDSLRFLPPIIQLIGVESVIIDIRSEINSLDRDVAQNDLRMEFYAEAEKIIKVSPKTGKEVLEEFRRLQDKTFKALNLQEDSIREVVNQIRLLSDGIETKNLAEIRFVSGPTLQNHRAGPGLVILFLLALLGGASAAAVLVFIIAVNPHEIDGHLSSAGDHKGQNTVS